MTNMRDLQKGLIKMISKNGKGNKWFIRQHMLNIPKTMDSTLSQLGNLFFILFFRQSLVCVEKIILFERFIRPNIINYIFYYKKTYNKILIL